MKRVFLLLVCLSLLMPKLSAQNLDKELVLDKHVKVQSVKFNNFLEVKAMIVEETDDGAIIGVTISNKDEGVNDSPYKVFLFMSPHNKDQLKKQKIKMKGDFFKSFNDKNSDKKTDHVQILGSEYMNDASIKLPLEYDTPLYNGDTVRLKLFPLPFNERIRLRLPTYICSKLEVKNGSLKNVEVIKEDIFDVEIEVKGKAKPKENLVLRELNTQLDELRQAISNASFCGHKSHAQNLAKQKKPYQDQLERLNERAQEELDKNGFAAGSDERKPFDDFFEAIAEEKQSLNKEKGTTCELCKNKTPTKPVRKDKKDNGHHCGYCDYSKSQIEKTMHTIAVDVQKNGKGDKAKATAIYNCPNARKNFSARATEDYNKIVSGPKNKFKEAQEKKEDKPKTTLTKDQIKSQLHNLAVNYRKADSNGKAKLKAQASNLYNIAKQQGWASDPAISRDYKVFQ